MRRAPWAAAHFVFPQVENGVARSHGFCGSEEVQRALRVLSGRVPGVQRLETDLTPPPFLAA